MGILEPIRNSIRILSGRSSEPKRRWVRWWVNHRSSFVPPAPGISRIAGGDSCAFTLGFCLSIFSISHFCLFLLSFILRVSLSLFPARRPITAGNFNSWNKSETKMKHKTEAPRRHWHNSKWNLPNHYRLRHIHIKKTFLKIVKKDRLSVTN